MSLRTWATIQFARYARKNIATGVIIDIPGGTAELSLSEDPALKIEAMKRCAIFEGLAYREVVKVVNIARTRNVKEGARLYLRGAPGDSFFVVLTGTLKAVRARRKIGVFETTDHFGELEVIDGLPRAATVTALSNSIIVEIQRKPLLKLIRQEPVLGWKLCWNIGRALAGQFRSVDRRFVKTVEEKLKFMERLRNYESTGEIRALKAPPRRKLKKKKKKPTE